MASEKMKTRYDARATGHDFHEGDKVWIWNPKRRKGLSPKLQTNWEAPSAAWRDKDHAKQRFLLLEWNPIWRSNGAANWSKWKRQIKLLLRHHDVYDVVCGDRKCPNLPAEASAEVVTAPEKLQKAFIKVDSLVQPILVGNMDDSNAELTAIYDTAKCVWEKLLSVYEQSSGQQLDRLMEKFFRNDTELEDDIVSHIARLQRNFSELNDELRRVAKTTCRISC
ncbi:retrovirus-related Pol polyprotein from transposon TNT 1-94 [Trichonephila clavipes]|nr:retrovirus-related Pol polyprotein from transposon TNT 1-94 [Trichonephila clavipes]